MNPHRPQRLNHEQLDLDREAEISAPDAVLAEITEDARRLKNRYPKETVVPEGGE